MAIVRLGEEYKGIKWLPFSHILFTSSIISFPFLSHSKCITYPKKWRRKLVEANLYYKPYKKNCLTSNSYGMLSSYFILNNGCCWSLCCQWGGNLLMDMFYSGRKCICVVDQNCSGIVDVISCSINTLIYILCIGMCYSHIKHHIQAHTQGYEWPALPFPLLHK